MGVYLNSRKPHDNYKELAGSQYFVDKSMIIEELMSIVELNTDILGSNSGNSGKLNKYICITRPRRFGKTVMANMIASFFGKGRDSRPVFENLKISSSIHFETHINKHNVFHITFNEMPRKGMEYDEYIDRIQNRIIQDLKRVFPDMSIDKNDAVWDVLNNIYEFEEDVKFIFVLDEWDYIFHQDFASDADKKLFLMFLSNLLKDQPYVEFAYMTGILPIAKYSSGSELNMFSEYTMANEEKYSEFFGFTDSDVDAIFERYKYNTMEQRVTREGLREWYDGYNTCLGERVYNPRSVVLSLINNNLGNYWTSAGPYDEIFYYIRHNVDAVRDDLALMVSGIPVTAKVREYAATSMNLTTKDEIFSAMVVYGFLSYEDGYVGIPNKELLNKFDDVLQKEPSLGYIYNLSRESERMLKATLAGDEETVCEILKYTHNTEIPLLKYNNEEDLTIIVTLAYLSARDFYTVEREEKAGVGYADFLFIPDNKKADCIILELKVDDTAENALRQIKDKKYELRFSGKLGEKNKYSGRILAVGIAYDKKTKEHSCKIEVLRNAISI